MLKRRQFIHWCSILLSIATAGLLAIPGMAMLFDPLRRSSKQRKWFRLAKLSDIEIGRPQKVVIIDRRVDAWVRYPEGPVGAVWVHRREDDTVDVFSVVCPHLGCAVEHQAGEHQYFCPCHEASYAEDGSIIAGPQQRGLDKLDMKIEMEGPDKIIKIVVEKFELGIPEKVRLG